MNQGFFNTSELQNVTSGGSRSRKCGACKLHKNSSTPKIEASGGGEKGILIIAESIGIFSILLILLKIIWSFYFFLLLAIDKIGE